MSQSPISNLQSLLLAAFRDQKRFAAGYSPLYAYLFGLTADWLAGEATDPVVEWLVEASAGRRPFDVTLLLPAGLHRDVLAGEPAAAELARYYPTAGGRPGALPPAAVVRAAILARREALAAFIGRAAVQTNETGRGLAWALPVACLGWPVVHLVELGASAGLNLLADRRVYRLADAADPARTVAQLGDGRPQFTILSRGAVDLPPALDLPTILSRTGGDAAPFHLHTAGDELTLAAFVWGDQPERLARLREGIAALRDVEVTAAPARLRPLRLPDELTAFLRRELPRRLDAPVVLFNTTVTMYLPDRGASLWGIIDEWAAAQAVPVLWLQWEPPAPDDSPPPEESWFAWTADLWPPGGEPIRRRLAWVHPHGTTIRWLERDWVESLRNSM
jgi:hypothetical protein